MFAPIVLCDLPNFSGRKACWSLNPWKARLVLNYKRLPYTTTWLSYPSVAPTLRSLDVPPNPPALNPNALYSIPAVRLPDGKCIMDSWAIARELETLHPQPSLRMDGNDLAERTQRAVGDVSSALGPVTLPRVAHDVLGEGESREYFETTREQRFGMTLAELERSTRGGEAAWEAAKPGLEALRELLAAKGPYVQGAEVSFADFVLAGFWKFCARLDHEGDLHGRLMRYDEAFARHWEACQEWLERDD